MAKKKILFCIENVRQGGISKALESILAFIEKSNLDIRIFCVNQKDGPYSDVFKKYFYRKQNWLMYALSAYYTEHRGAKRAWLIFVKAIGKILKRLFNVDLLSLALANEAKRISKENFDVVIAFSEGIITHFCPLINTKKRIAWIHLDYKRYLSYTNNIDEKEIYSKYDSIVIPSKHCSNSFTQIFPQLQDKIVVIPNFVNSKRIKELSLAEENLDERFACDDVFKIVSVGRICYEKRFFEIPSIAKVLKERNLKFKWYIIGSGSEKESSYLIKQIQQHGVEENVILLGAKNNPYPYIRHSQLLAVTSLTETFCYAIAEAKTLGVPVITTNFGTAYEVLESENGVICDIADFSETISKIIEDTDWYYKLSDSLKKYKCNNDYALNLFVHTTSY